jgi:hypothetical protein
MHKTSWRTCSKAGQVPEAQAKKNYNYHKAVLLPMDVSCHHVILWRKTMSKQKLAAGPVFWCQEKFG